MASFSFNCPQCGRVYENVKSKMAGRKVRCTCGKIFRLGPKTEDQADKSAKRKSKKRTGNNPTGNEPANPDPGPKSPSAPDSLPENVGEVIPEDQQVFSPAIFEDDALLDVSSSELYVEPTEQEIHDSAVLQKEAWALATPAPFRKKLDKSKVKRESSQSDDGSIWKRIMSLFGR